MTVESKAVNGHIEGYGPEVEIEDEGGPRFACLAVASALRSAWRHFLAPRTSSRGMPLTRLRMPEEGRSIGRMPQDHRACVSQASRQPCAWMLPGIWIGSRSQLVRSTDSFSVTGHALLRSMLGGRTVGLVPQGGPESTATNLRQINFRSFARHFNA